jgi:hypothetical protein
MAVCGRSVVNPVPLEWWDGSRGARLIILDSITGPAPSSTADPDKE